MYKKLLTVEDLLLFCKDKKLQTFSSKDSGYKIAVQVPARFEIQDSSNDPHRGMMKLKIWAFHEGKNENMSYFSHDVAIQAAKTFEYRPILANIHCVDEDKDEWDFGSHDFEYYIGNDGKPAINYIEKQVGAYSSEPAFFEIDPVTGYNYVCAYAYIPEDYTRAASIIRQKGGTVHSCEFIIEDFQYNEDEDQIEFLNCYLNGSTLLGRDAETGAVVAPGMKNSHAEIVDFSAENNSIIPNNNELLAEMKKITSLLSTAFNNNSGKEEGNQMKVSEQFVIDTLAKYGKTVDDVDFEYTEMTEEDFEAKCAELFGEAEPEAEPDAEPEEPAEDPVNPEVAEPEIEDSVTDPDTPASDPEVTEPEATAEENFTVKFEISHDDIRSSIYKALWELDKANHYDTSYYVVSVFDDHFIYGDWASMDNKFFKQLYSKDNDTVTFNGTPVTVYAEYVTDEERNALDAMRSNYAELKAFKDNFDKQALHEQREQILNSADYSVMADDAAFAELVENMDNYSLEELQNRADLCFAAFVKKSGSFSRKTTDENDKPNNVLHFGLNANIDENSKAKQEAYPGLFIDD